MKSKLASDDVTLRFERVVPGDPDRGFVPYCHFRIVSTEGVDVGHINFRIGESEHVRLTAGHIGFEVAEEHRGHAYALKACRAIAPFVATVYASVIITTDPDNVASKRTIENLGAEFLDEAPVPAHDPHYARGSRSKLRYTWSPKPGDEMTR